MRAQQLVTTHSNGTCVTSRRTSPLELTPRKLQEQEPRDPQLAKERCTQPLALALKKLALRTLHGLVRCTRPLVTAGRQMRCTPRLELVLRTP